MKVNQLVTLSVTCVAPTWAFSPQALSADFPHINSKGFGLTVHRTANLYSALHMSSITEEIQPLQDFYQETSLTETNTRSYLDDGFVFGLEGSGLERPKGKVANLVVEGDSLETQPYQIAMVSATMAAHAAFAINSINQLSMVNNGDIGTTLVQTMLVLWSSWLIADFGSGVFHWSVDNYGNGRTPIMGGIIAAFQGHHSAPWTISQRGFCNNVYKLCIPFGIPTMTLINAVTGPATTLFFASFCALEILSQEFHKWSHMTKKEVPSFVNILQDLGVTIGRKPHALHHMAPFEGNYCIVSGACNEVLDKSGFFRWMELQIYLLNGVESNAWKLDHNLRERTLKGDFSLPTAQVQRKNK